MSMPIAASILGMILGAAMITAVLHNWLKRQTFGAGGFVLTFSGVLLIGLSIWSSVRINVSLEGGFEAVFDQRLTQVQAAVQRLDQRVIDVRADVTEAIESVPDVPKESLELLRKRNQVNKLLDEQKYSEALRLDPRNVIALVEIVLEHVERGKYKEAVLLHNRLREVSFSGTVFDAYPALAFAYERLGKFDQAISVLREIDSRISYDAEHGGWMSDRERIDTIILYLQHMREDFPDNKVRHEIDALIQKLQKQPGRKSS